ncbi:hypothetical protein JY651_22875 [Pyxidicoccus parkwayensis]|uniref:Baseplate protein J-like domain-containing protein n=1 Tax=Pyxidicoccus parkwayensis TaxID=2813578 RepID=A0ABX7PAT2_9BACT|nr:phage tail protein [Pyxidicoccus parkwaysis]QSQ27581.1 hypothetical protein JY651_22875 [Pyxidicoccus parkwaysis]
MSTAPQDRLYKLLPAVYRGRDALQGEPLRALLAIIERELLAVEDDIGQLHDNWFIETCQEWVVPYLGDLLGVRDLIPVDPSLFSQRAYVANTLAYRRRKGTAAMLEQLARDVTGWPAHVVEFFERVGTTQHVNHVRLHALRTPDLRDANTLELVSTPFEQATRTVDVRHIDNRRGKHNLANVGVFLWRLEAYPVVGAPAAPVAPGSEPGVEGPGYFRFSVLGNDTPLFNPPQSETAITSLASEVNVPGRLRRKPLSAELEARRAALVRGESPEELYFGAAPAFTLYLANLPAQPTAYEPEALVLCDLSTWHRPPDKLTYQDADGNDVEVSILAGVDPVTGRIAFVPGQQPDRLHVSYSYGFSSEVGGGFYDRQDTLPPAEERAVYRVSYKGPHATVGHALIAWHADLTTGAPRARDALIEVQDSSVHAFDQLHVPAGVKLELRAANLQRPVLEVPGATCVVRLDAGAEAILNGFIVKGGTLDVRAGDDAALTLRHCTLVPGLALRPDGSPREPTAASLTVRGAGVGSCAVSLVRCISGLILAGQATRLLVEDSIVDGLGGPALGSLPEPGTGGGGGGGQVLAPEEDAAEEVEQKSGPGEAPPPEEPSTDSGAAGRLTVRASTVLGDVEATVLELASDSLFTGIVSVVQRQKGCMRFSHVPAGSHVPTRFRCQPAYAEDATAEVKEEVERRVWPVFTSLRYGDPGYCQLLVDADDGIRRGASDEGEMGVFHHLQQPQREANLRASLKDYLRFGLEAGIFFVT